MDSKPTTNDASDPSRCPQCGAEVVCGAVLGAQAPGGEMRCWCLDWPRLPVSARSGAATCLCAACLRAALRAAGVETDGAGTAPGKAS
ncbi:hypothetical protein UC34_01325 [Pandoraea vervacti]|uniref:Cysteine-rich CWC family protein n=1 Tax=Pandoraea vervacti TaxID=656178 RepID=A0ABN4FL28_9BURK|nr:hypothetical protein UC34_01325 [Pandoraea vervacti]